MIQWRQPLFCLQFKHVYPLGLAAATDPQVELWLLQLLGLR